jgi:4-hydroxybenzoyl-CoA thioesterase
MTVAAPESGRFERVQRIRFAHCDPAGIVFYPQYFVMLQNHVEDWFTDGLGIAYAGLVSGRRVGLPTVSLQTEFTAISRFGDEVVLGLAVERLGGSSLTLALDVRGADGPRVQLRKVIVCTRLDAHRAQAWPDDVRAAIDAFRRGMAVPAPPPAA